MNRPRAYVVALGGPGCIPRGPDEGAAASPSDGWWWLVTQPDTSPTARLSCPAGDGGGIWGNRGSLTCPLLPRTPLHLALLLGNILEIALHPGIWPCILGKKEIEFGTRQTVESQNFKQDMHFQLPKWRNRCFSECLEHFCSCTPPALSAPLHPATPRNLLLFSTYVEDFECSRCLYF